MGTLLQSSEGISNMQELLYYKLTFLFFFFLTFNVVFKVHSVLILPLF